MAELSDSERVALLEQRLGLQPGCLRPELALEALRLRGWINEQRQTGQPVAESNERLEFLGDAVLQLLVSERCWTGSPKAPEGELTRQRAALVRTEALAQLARTLGLGDLLLLDRGERKSGGRDKQSLLADAFEATVAAVYLSLGFEAAGALVDRLFGPLLEQARTEGFARDWKTELQGSLQRTHRAAPDYVVLDAPGPPHARTFDIEVRFAGVPLGRGQGRSKKEAEQAAARVALDGEALGALAPAQPKGSAPVVVELVGPSAPPPGPDAG